MNVDPHSEPALGLARYVEAVAVTLGVPMDAVDHEISDLSSAYLALDGHNPTFPDHDLMLVWDERVGWSVGVETHPLAPPAVLSYLGCDVLAAPRLVRRFVDEVIAGNYPGQPDAPLNLPVHDLTERLALFPHRSMSNY